jgi:hypothetical protein
MVSPPLRAGASLLAASGLAGVTIYTTRQRLVGERERLAATLAHDRALSDIADLRQLLDETASVVHRISKTHEYAWLYLDLPPSYKDLSKLEPELQVKLEEAVQPLTLLTPRIRLRLGADDAITKTCEEIEAAAGSMSRAVFEYRIRSSDTGKALEIAAEAIGGMTEATQAFFALASERAGALIPPHQ